MEWGESISAILKQAWYYFDHRDFVAAERYARCAVLEDPESAEAHCLLGTALLSQHKFESAEGSLREALRIDPMFSLANANLGHLLILLGCSSDAEEAIEFAIKTAPRIPRVLAELRWSLSLARLAQGKYLEAWAGFEQRIALSAHKGDPMEPHLSQPVWLGEALAGRRLLLWPEQGFGDQIQMIRFAPVLKARGASEVLVVCDPVIAPLLRTARGVDSVIPWQVGQPMPVSDQYDCWAHLLSIPALLNVSIAEIPGTLPYVSADPDRVSVWRKKMPEGEFLVGLNWQGRGTFAYDRFRSFENLDEFLPLLSLPDISFVALQHGRSVPWDDMKRAYPTVTMLGEEIEDFADTAAIISMLDLVITTDTAVAHLAGALGKKVWVLVSKVGSDWRWLEKGAGSNWYPEVMRLFRQTQLMGWSATLQRVKQELKTYSLP